MIEEQRRHRMVDALIAAHGEEVAMTMTESIFSMEHATKADLKALEARMDERFATKVDLERAMNVMSWRVVGAMASMTAICSAVTVLAT